MDSYLLIKFIHVMSSTLLFGTGLGTAFHGWMAGRSRNLDATLVVNRNVVLADWIFTTPAVIVQPVTGVWLALHAGFPLTEGWLALAIVLYLFVGACWLPVVWLQLQMHKMLVTAKATNTPLPGRYGRFARLWFLLGWPAFISVIGIFYLMILKPEVGF
ncbi:MAG: DUF2269 family protein [Elstera sp.]